VRPTTIQDIPENVVQINDFQEIFEEILVAETYINGLRFSADSLKQMTLKSYAQIADKHGIDLETLYRTLDYYTTQPKLFEKIVGNTIDSLNALLLKYDQKE